MLLVASTLSVALLGHRLSYGGLLGSLLALAGVVLVVSSGQPATLLHSGANGGDALMLVAMLAYAILNSSMSNCIVLDPFGGSGSTLIACEQTGRVCDMIELDEKYCDVIVKRYIEQVGNADSVNLIRDGEKQAYSELATEAAAS